MILRTALPLFLALALGVAGPTARADVAEDLMSGADPLTVIDNAIGEGQEIGTVVDRLAQIVGSDRIGALQPAVALHLAVETGDPGRAMRESAILVDGAASRGYPGTQLGRNYLQLMQRASP